MDYYRTLYLTLTLFGCTVECLKQPSDCPNDKANPAGCMCFRDGDFNSKSWKASRYVSEQINFDEGPTLSHELITWKYTKKTKRVSSGATFAAYTRQTDSTYLPLPTCCGVPLKNKKCSVKVKLETKVFYSVTINGSMWIATNAMKENRLEVPKTKPDVVYKVVCKNKQKVAKDQMCIAINTETGKVFLYSQIFKATNNGHKIDGKRNVLFATCSFELSQDQIDHLTLLPWGEGISRIFKTKVWNATSYAHSYINNESCNQTQWFNFAKINYTTKRDHYLCFRYRFAAQPKFYYCLGPQVQEYTNVPSEGASSVLLAIGFGALAVCMLGIFALIFYSRRRLRGNNENKEQAAAVVLTEKGSVQKEDNDNEQAIPMI